MHRIWEQKEITFVGPISEDNLKMFPSLTYYLLLPSTIIGDFDPLSPVAGCVGSREKGNNIELNLLRVNH